MAAASPGFEPHGEGDGEGDDGAELAAQGQEHGAVGARQDEADVEQDADAHEDQAGDEAVRKRERVERLEEVDLENVDEGRRIADEWSHEEVAVHPHAVCHGHAVVREARSHWVEEERPRVDRSHPEPHGNHEEWLECPLLPQVDEHEGQEDEPDAGPKDERVVRIGIDECRDAPEQLQRVPVHDAVFSLPTSCGRRRTSVGAPPPWPWPRWRRHRTPSTRRSPLVASSRGEPQAIRRRVSPASTETPLWARISTTRPA